MSSQVVTYQVAPNGDKISLTVQQIKMLEQAGKWPRNKRGEEYCSVSYGRHTGEPSMTDAELRAKCRI